jgi:glycosyltransferase involved in cell wall biosynthesis
MVGSEIKIGVVVPTGEKPRSHRFLDSFDQLASNVKSGTVIIKPHGQSPARNRNVGIEQALNHNCTHILFLDDDLIFPTDIIDRLLAHNKDIVSGLYLMRAFPHRPIIFDVQNEEGFCRWMQLSPDKTGLIEVASTGLGCALINSQIFMKLDKPWIRLGEVEKDHWCDDLGFYNRVKRLGYKIYCDLDLRCGHVGEIAVFPSNLEGKWFTTYDTQGEGTASIPQQYLTKEEFDKALESV